MEESLTPPSSWAEYDIHPGANALVIPTLDPGDQSVSETLVFSAGWDFVFQQHPESESDFQSSQIAHTAYSGGSGICCVKFSGRVKTPEVLVS